MHILFFFYLFLLSPALLYQQNSSFSYLAPQKPSIFCSLFSVPASHYMKHLIPAFGVHVIKFIYPVHMLIHFVINSRDTVILFFINVLNV